MMIYLLHKCVKNNDITIIIKEYIVNSEFAKILLEDYMTIKLRAHN